MSAPVIFIIIPLLMVIPLWLLRKSRSWTISIGGVICVLLAMFATLVPIASPIRLGNIYVEIDSSLFILGRQFILEDLERPQLVLIFGLGALWSFGAMVVQIKGHFMTYALAILALLVAALSVQPFLYAAVIIEVAVLISVPMMVQPGSHARKGVLRYVIFQSLAMPFILISGWAFSSSGLVPGDETALIQAVLILALGFAFWLAIFPFYTWVPMLAAEVHPYMFGFVMTVLPTAILLFLLDFLNAYPFLRESSLMFSALRFSGILMVVSSGGWAIFERDLRRLLAYAVILETGLALIALSLHNPIGLNYYAISFLPRQIAIALGALGLSIVINKGIDPMLKNTGGLFWKYPLLSAAILIAFFSLNGLPLLAAFPIRLPMLTALVQVNTIQVIWVMAGLALMSISGIKILAYFTKANTDNFREPLLWYESGFILAGIVIILLMGIFPLFFIGPMQSILEAFEFLIW